MNRAFSRPLLSFRPSQRIFSSKMSEVAQSLGPKFVAVEDGENIFRNLSDGFVIRVVSYNILAQVYVKSSLFPHSPRPCLRWKARSRAILAVLKSLDADFFCIQELDEFDSFYKGKMERFGYSSIYLQRTGVKRDGCCIFYKHDRAHLILEEKIEYNDLLSSVEDGTISCSSESNNVPDIEYKKATTTHQTSGLPDENGLDNRGNLNDPRVRLKRDCVGILAAFKLTDPSHHVVIVVNTHLYWDPEFADVKLAQANYLLSRLAQFKALVCDKFGGTPSVIIAGDFNSTPGDKVYKFLVSDNSDEHSSLEESLIQLWSLYAYLGGEPHFTNCTPDFTGTLDYIFFSDSGCLKPVSLLQLPAPESPDVIGGLPNYNHPSDHLPIGADFEIIRT